MTTVLSCERLAAGYGGGTAVVRDFDLRVDAGEVIALLGPNGAGKTTTLLTIAGLLPRISGSISLSGQRTDRRSGRSMARNGVVLVPDDRALFTTLTVKENLAVARRKDSPSERVILKHFPQLTERLNVAAGSLSGGEQQMLAIGRALVQSPKILLIDELSMGLAPRVVQNLLPVVRGIADEDGIAVVVVEQHVDMVLAVADRGVVLVHGTVALTDRAQSLRADRTRLQAAYLSG